MGVERIFSLTKNGDRAFLQPCYGMSTTVGKFHFSDPVVVYIFNNWAGVQVFCQYPGAWEGEVAVC